MRRVRYGTREGYESKEEPASATIRRFEGKVRVHPAFKLELDEQGAVLSTHADLAIIVLDSPVEEPLPRVPFAETEVQENETLVMAGYGDDPRFRDVPYFRYFPSGFTKAKGGHESWFTSTFYYRNWIERQKRDPSIN